MTSGDQFIRTDKQAIPFETDDVLAERIRRVADGLSALARELGEVANILDPKDDDS
ncbi:MAG: hypothetical protein ACLPV4_12825 [Solirubrobacteraceae bacterium]